MSAAKPRVALRGHPVVSRHVDFRNHIYTTYRRIFNNLPYVLLRVVASVQGLAVHLAQMLLRQTHRRIMLIVGPFLTSLVNIFIRRIPPGSLVGEKRVSPDLDSPCLGVDQVPMEFGEFVERHKVKEILGLLHRIEVAGRVGSSDLSTW